MNIMTALELIEDVMEQLQVVEALLADFGFERTANQINCLWKKLSDAYDIMEADHGEGH